jgi:hypothetical protein
MSDSRCVEVAAATSPRVFDRTEWMTYRAGALMNMSRS